LNILFITLIKTDSLSDRGIYTDLLRRFEEDGNTIYVVCPNERRDGRKTEIIVNNKLNLLRVKTFNIQKASLIEKGLGTLAIEYQFLFAIKKYFKNTKFDLVIHSTPPITFTKVINYIRKRDRAVSYLLLKDIFPQNAVDMKLITKNGFLHKFFRRKEKKLYGVSDYIGCLSKANVEYLKTHDSYLKFNNVEINPNSIIPNFINYSSSEKDNIKLKYGIPLDKKIFIYGGNLGRPQGIEFLLDTIQNCKRSDVYFLIIGSGTEFVKIKKWFDNLNPENACLFTFLPKNDYDKLLAACDVGLIFLHKDFTIPNYPSRLLSYLEMKMPIIAATDPNTDVGLDIEKNKCGYWVISGDTNGMQKAIDNLINDTDYFKTMKENAWKFLMNEFTSEKSFKLIKEKINKNS
jgi:glycosyltransferase involved in cell wall biosynthesis